MHHALIPMQHSDSPTEKDRRPADSGHACCNGTPADSGHACSNETPADSNGTPADRAPDGVRYTYFREKTENGQRRIVVAWRCEGTNLVRYGACIYREPKDCPPNARGRWNKRAHRQTALERFERHPVVVCLPTELDGLPADQRNETLRRLLFRHGVRERSKDQRGSTAIDAARAYTSALCGRALEHRSAGDRVRGDPLGASRMDEIVGL